MICVKRTIKIIKGMVELMLMDCFMKAAVVE